MTMQSLEEGRKISKLPRHFKIPEVFQKPPARGAKVSVPCDCDEWMQKRTERWRNILASQSRDAKKILP